MLRVILPPLFFLFLSVAESVRNSPSVIKLSQRFTLLFPLSFFFFFCLVWGILESASGADFPVSPSNHFGFTPRLLYSSTHHSSESFTHLEIGWAQDAWLLWLYENWYYHLDISRWRLPFSTWLAFFNGFQFFSSKNTISTGYFLLGVHALLITWKKKDKLLSPFHFIVLSYKGKYSRVPIWPCSVSSCANHRKDIAWTRILYVNMLNVRRYVPVGQERVMYGEKPLDGHG